MAHRPRVRPHAKSTRSFPRPPSGQRVYGYENLLVCDGAAIPANVGVNPSLTITALAEHAMSHVPTRGESADAARLIAAA